MSNSPAGGIALTQAQPARYPQADFAHQDACGNIQHQVLAHQDGGGIDGKRQDKSGDFHPLWHAAAAGKAAHLGGVVAAYTPDPVIAVPMKTSDLGGLDSLLSMVQMPSGVPVACVAINGAKNAAILAVQMLGTNCDGCRQKIIDFKAAMAEA